MTELLPEYRVDAERALLGMLLEAPQFAETCGVGLGDFCDGMGHREIFAAIAKVYEETQAGHPALIVQELIRTDQITRVGIENIRGAGYVAELIQHRGVGTMGFYARIIREARVRRDLKTIGEQLIKTATTQGDLDITLDNAGQLFEQLRTVVDNPVDGDSPIGGLSTVADFVREHDEQRNWVIPGVVEEQDRIMIVAGEGVGKSVLARQVCTLLAAGRHPFMPSQAIRPRRTLLIDLENPPPLTRRGLRGLVQQIHDEHLDVADRAWRWSRPGGMDIRSVADQQLLARVIDMVRPDLIAIGPLYKASMGKATDTYEIAAAETARQIDRLRERHNVAWWIEHHAPKSNGPDGNRHGPIGSSYWLRWPEFGLVLKWAGENEKDTYLLDRFRGDREERCWPDKLMKRAGRWPWTADWDDDEDRQRLFNAIDEEKADGLRRQREARDHDRTEIAGSKIPYSMPAERRYGLDDDEPAPGVSNPSIQAGNAGHHSAAAGPEEGGPLPVDPENSTAPYSGFDEGLPEPPLDYDDEGYSHDPIF